jgi:hypothetical protein
MRTSRPFLRRPRIRTDTSKPIWGAVTRRALKIRAEKMWSSSTVMRPSENHRSMMMFIELTCRNSQRSRGSGAFIHRSHPAAPGLHLLADRLICLNLARSADRSVREANSGCNARTEIGLYLIRCNVSIDNSPQTINDHLPSANFDSGLRLETTASGSTRPVVAETQMPSTPFPHGLAKVRASIPMTR